jgi:uncharacterized protein involved in high-affinity Fe2+ transport
MLNGQHLRGRNARPVRAFMALSALAVTGAVAALAAGGSGAAGGATTTGMSGMSGMAGGAAMPKAMPIRELIKTTWQGMTIEARSMAPATFEIFSGTSERMVKPTKKDTIHLMVMLSDSQTDTAIPYASVWATIRNAEGKIVYDERQWPMLSRAMGTHYGNNVALPAKGTYKLTLLISPPQAARHIEYSKVWLKPHRVTKTFRWTGT